MGVLEQFADHVFGNVRARFRNLLLERFERLFEFESIRSRLFVQPLAHETQHEAKSFGKDKISQGRFDCIERRGNVIVRKRFFRGLYQSSIQNQLLESAHMFFGDTPLRQMAFLACSNLCPKTALQP